jgi:molybdenum cofactor cytidylyltransferase
MTSYAIIPAAGRSTRMGAPKLLLPWGDSTIIEHVLAAWRASRVDRILVVVHPDNKRLAERCQGDRVTVVVPNVPPPEMKDSVVVCLRHIQENGSPHDGDCWLLAPADVPNLSVGVINRLLDEHARSLSSPMPVILAPSHAGRRGHPVLFAWRLAKEVFALSGSEGVNQLLKCHPVSEVPVGAEELADDVDTLQDYRRLAPPR